MNNLLPIPILLLCAVVALPGSSQAGIRRIKTSEKVVALTFDDGPNPPFTEQLLAVLAKKRAKATFFLIGKQIEAHPETARKILAAGYEVGGHSYDWTTLAFKKKSFVNAQLDKMDAAFRGIGVTNLVLFRPPNGFLSFGQGKILRERHLENIAADVVVGDWKTTDPKKIQQRILKKVRPGSIIVLHDGGGDRSATLAAVPGIIDALRNEGYKILTVSGLLDLGGGLCLKPITQCGVGIMFSRVWKAACGQPMRRSFRVGP